MGDRQHRWGLVTVAHLDPDEATTLAGYDLAERLDLYAAGAGPSPYEIRGPICLDCRVHHRDVHANPDKPWPCPGERPRELGGPLVQPERHLSRQQRRALQRSALKAVK